VQRTLSIIKPDGVKRNLVGKIVTKFEENNIRVAAMKMVWLSLREAAGFYAVHEGKSFYQELVDYMASGPVVLMVLEGENVIERNRAIMGATDPSKAAAGTIRREFAVSIGQNTVHGSDAPQTAATEISYFFSSTELVNG
jgi:nucleoside-diphosphate kinase